MTINLIFFTEQMGRLSGRFPRAYESKDLAEMIWRECSRLNNHQMSQVVDELIGSSRQPPLVKEFRDAVYSELSKSGSKEKKEINWDTILTVDCDTCKDMGVYLCMKKDHTGSWAFRCHCKKGNEDPRKQIPQFKDWHREQGFFWIDPMTLKQVEAKRMQTGDIQQS